MGDLLALPYGLLLPHGTMHCVSPWRHFWIMTVSITEARLFVPNFFVHRQRDRTARHRRFGLAFVDVHHGRCCSTRREWRKP